MFAMLAFFFSDLSESIEAALFPEAEIAPMSGLGLLFAE
jgi:hypothetical protein